MIQTASIVGLAKTILIIVLCFTIFKYVMRLLAPFFLRSIARKMERQFHQNAPTNSTQKEGEISIDKSPKKHSSNNDIGEYIDYEEID
jgi:high-affinity Fe2+/Pb2+ permease